MAIAQHTDPSLNMVEILKKHLEERIREHAKGRIVNELVSEFKEKIEREVEDYVSEITLNSIHHMKDHLMVRDELAIAISINGELNTEKMI